MRVPLETPNKKPPPIPMWNRTKPTSAQRFSLGFPLKPPRNGIPKRRPKDNHPEKNQETKREHTHTHHTHRNKQKRRGNTTAYVSWFLRFCHGLSKKVFTVAPFLGPTSTALSVSAERPPSAWPRRSSCRAGSWRRRVASRVSGREASQVETACG